MKIEVTTCIDAQSNGRRVPAGWGLLIGISILLLLIWLGSVALDSRSTTPDVAPDFSPSQFSNSLVLTEERVRSLGLTTREAVEINGVLFVPLEALQEAPNGFYLWVEDYGIRNNFIKSRVTPGIKKDGLIEIIRGIFPGDKVVVHGAEKIRFAADARPLSLKEAIDLEGTHIEEHDSSSKVEAKADKGTPKPPAKHHEH